MAQKGSVNRKTAEADGRRAEYIAALWLRLKGYRILQHRYRCNAGEIDLIARRGETIAMVEVKRRKTHEQARTAVTEASERRIGAAAAIWLARNRPNHDGPVRYDLVTIATGLPKHWPDAWRPAQRQHIVNPDDLF